MATFETPTFQQALNIMLAEIGLRELDEKNDVAIEGKDLLKEAFAPPSQQLKS